MRWIILVLALCATGLITDSAAARRKSPPLTKLEIRRAPQARVRRHILEQLTGDLIVPDQSREKGTTPVRPLEDVWLYTHAYGTSTPGLCRQDLLMVKFLPVGPEKGAATPVRATGLDTTHLYRLLRDIDPKEAGSLDHRGLVAADAECAALDAINTHFFINEAGDGPDDDREAQVVEAIWQLRRVVRAAASGGNLPFKLRCLELLKDEEEQCRKELSLVDPEKTLLSLDKCAAQEGESTALPCWGYSAVDTDGRPTLEIEIHAHRSDYRPDKKDKAVPLVQVEQQIVFIEVLID